MGEALGQSEAEAKALQQVRLGYIRQASAAAVHARASKE
jgi:hypothetical protein